MCTHSNNLHNTRHTYSLLRLPTKWPCYFTVMLNITVVRFEIFEYSILTNCWFVNTYGRLGGPFCVNFQGSLASNLRGKIIPVMEERARDDKCIQNFSKKFWKQNISDAYAEMQGQPWNGSWTECEVVSGASVQVAMCSFCEQWNEPSCTKSAKRIHLQCAYQLLTKDSCCTG
jgi:hypothetical protein